MEEVMNGLHNVTQRECDLRHQDLEKRLDMYEKRIESLERKIMWLFYIAITQLGALVINLLMGFLKR